MTHIEMAETWIAEQVAQAKWSSSQYDLDVQCIAKTCRSLPEMLARFAEYVTKK
jgi:hypothetical protein